MTATYTAHEQFGVFAKTNKQTVSKKLDRMPYAQAGIIFDSNGTHLISYTTRVITIDPEGWLTCTGTYSATTRKHISAFMHEYAKPLTYYSAKDAYEKHYKINIYTGEIIPL